MCHSFIIMFCFLAVKCQEKLNIGFILGGFGDPYFQESGKFHEAIQFLKRLSNSFQVNFNGVGVGLITYGSSGHVSFDLHPFVTAEHLTKAIEETSAPDVGGNLNSGLQMSNDFWHKSLLSRDKLSSIVVVTAGQSDGSAKEASEKLKGLGVEIFAVGVGDAALKTELNAIASRPLTNHVFTASYGGLEELSPLLGERICEGECAGTTKDW